MNNRKNDFVLATGVRIRRVFVAVILAGLLGAAAAPAATSENLLVNGDAELERCTHDWTAQTSVPGWRVTRGAAAVLCYSAFSFTHETPSLPSTPAAGKALFVAPGADTAMEQGVDVSAAATGIDQGRVSFSVSAWLGGWRDRTERATLTAVFLDRQGRSTRPPLVLADADAAARGGHTGLVERQIDGRVPRGTRRIRLTVQFLTGTTSFNNAFADNIRLTLSGPIKDLHAAAAQPPPSRVPALDHVFVVMMENTNFADVIHAGPTTVSIDPKMPFFGELAQKGVTLSNVWGTYHPSDQNYVAMIAGDTYKYGLTYFPDYDLPQTQLGDLLAASAKNWRAYVQDMGTPCSLTSHGGDGKRSFSPDDEPFVQFEDVIGDKSQCKTEIRGLADLVSDAAAGKLPAFAWIAADNWYDGEGAWYEEFQVGFSNAKQDQFLEQTLQPLLQSAAWRESRSLLIVTWDESSGWGWPDNRVPTVLVGSPGLLRAGTVMHEHVNGYDVLRTAESALKVGSLGRFDKFAQPMNAVFADPDRSGPGAVSEADENRPAEQLWPTPFVSTRGHIDDTFGQVTKPAAVYRGEPVSLVVPAGAEASMRVNFEPLGHVPTPSSAAYRFESDAHTVTIPTEQLTPGIYGAWLRRGDELPSLAPVLVSVLPPRSVTPDSPGVAVIGATSSGSAAGLSVREGSNLGVYYCFPAGLAPDNGWVGIFTAGTPVSQMTKGRANRIGFWLKTPAGSGTHYCGETQAFASELAPGTDYQVLLFRDQAGIPTPVGHTDSFEVTAVLPH